MPLDLGLEDIVESERAAVVIAFRIARCFLIVSLKFKAILHGSQDKDYESQFTDEKRRLRVVTGLVQGHLAAWCLPPNINPTAFPTNHGTSYYHYYFCE